MKIHLAEPMVTSSPLLIHHGLSQQEWGSGLILILGTDVDLSSVVLTVIPNSPSNKILFRISDGLLVLKGEAKLSI